MRRHRLLNLAIAGALLAYGPATMAAPKPKVPAAAPAPGVAELKQEGYAIVDANADHIGRVSDAIFSYSEIGFQEFKTIELLKKELEANGFKVETGVAGMPTAYMATYGSGGPVIGLMSEYDGIPGASQKPTALVHDPVVKGAPGHGEGHSVNQPVVVAAAIAIKDLKQKYNLPGTIIVYGGPAEELLASRPYMVKAGLFKPLDVMMDAHIGTRFGTTYGLDNLAIISAQWRFHGRQAHAAQAWQGRSALDAVEIMDTSMNFMREHIDPWGRIHYVIPDAGRQPNVVPADATVWYYFRHRTAADVWDLFARAREAAKGAALASGTTVSERILSASWALNFNKSLAELLQSNIEAVGMPKWTEDDQTFAKRFQRSMGAKVVGLETEVSPLKPTVQRSSSSDAGDVTWQVPHVRLSVPAKAEGELAGHHWSAAIGPATPIAHKGISAAAKALMGTAVDLMTDPAKLAAIKADFQAQLARYPKWSSMMPPDAEPGTHLNREEMAKYREALKPYEYDPNSKQTYFEFLKVKYPPDEVPAGAGKASNATAGE